MRDNEKPIMFVRRTNALLADQGYTYNQAGLTYNQIGVQYGGKYENDIIPMTLTIRPDHPTMSLALDVGGSAISHGTIILGKGMLIGILGLTYPADGTIIF